MNRVRLLSDGHEDVTWNPYRKYNYNMIEFHMTKESNCDEAVAEPWNEVKDNDRMTDLVT